MRTVGPLHRDYPPATLARECNLLGFQLPPRTSDSLYFTAMDPTFAVHGLALQVFHHRRCEDFWAQGLEMPREACITSVLRDRTRSSANQRLRRSRRETISADAVRTKL